MFLSEVSVKDNKPEEWELPLKKGEWRGKKKYFCLTNSRQLDSRIYIHHIHYDTQLHSTKNQVSLSKPTDVEE